MIFSSALSLDKPLRHIDSMRELDYPYKTRYFRLKNGLEVAYGDLGQGQGEAVIFIHGLGSYGPAWSKNAYSLKESFRSIIPDLPGFGKSDKTGWDVSIEAVANHLIELADELELERFILAGHSMGAQIALRIAYLAGDRVKFLILSAPAGFEPFTDDENAWMLQFYAPDILRYTIPAQVYMNFTQNFHSLPKDALFMVRHRIEMSYTREFPDYCKIVPRCIAAMQQDRPETYFPKIKQKVIAVYGEEDRLIPNKMLHPHLSLQDVMENGRRLIPQIHISSLPKTGHFPHWERDEEFNLLFQGKI